MPGVGMASGSKMAYWADKIAVDAEPGLSHTQLMVCAREMSG